MIDNLLNEITTLLPHNHPACRAAIRGLSAGSPRTTNKENT